MDIATFYDIKEKLAANTADTFVLGIGLLFTDDDYEQVAVEYESDSCAPIGFKNFAELCKYIQLAYYKKWIHKKWEEDPDCIERLFRPAAIMILSKIQQLYQEQKQ